jgi:hypothetical protein
MGSTENSGASAPTPCLRVCQRSWSSLVVVEAKDCACRMRRGVQTMAPEQTCAGLPVLGSPSWRCLHAASDCH